MLLPIFLALLAAAPSGSTSAAAAPVLPTVRVEAAGFLHDARASLDDAAVLHFQARVDGPMTLDRTTFVVENLDAAGRVLASRTVHARIDKGTARHRHARSARFTLALETDVTVAFVRVRSAD